MSLFSSTTKNEDNLKVYLSPSKTRFKVVIFIILAVLLIIVVVAKIDTIRSLIPGNTSIGTQIPDPIKQLVLYPQNPDPTGRDIYYKSPIGLANISYSGVGVYHLTPNSEIREATGSTLIKIDQSTKLTDYIVGSFVRWESIEDSKDKYLILNDNLHTQTTTAQTVFYPKIRVGFETGNTNNTTTFSTAFGVEDLNTLATISTQNTSTKRMKIAKIGALAEEQINNLIKPNDTIALTLKTDLNKKQDLTDIYGEKVASWLYIRRFNPKELEELLKPITIN